MDQVATGVISQALGAIAAASATGGHFETVLQALEGRYPLVTGVPNLGIGDLVTNTDVHVKISLDDWEDANVNDNVLQ
jgi:hypothetical protein